MNTSQQPVALREATGAGGGVEPLRKREDPAGVTKVNTTQRDALYLAEHLEKFRSFPDDLAAAAELRRLHSRVQELEAAQERVPLSDGRLVEAIESFTGFIYGDVDKFVAHIEAAHGITQEKQG